MSEELSLVTELAVILIAAGVFTVISKALKQPLILGYIIAGFLVGPHLGLFPQFSTEAVHQWSELGIIFLLFGLGLEFSFKKLLQVGSAALITAGVNCIGMFIVGNIVGHALNFTSMESIFLGGMLSMSSTTIIIKSYSELGLKDKPYASLIFGTLVVEDLIAVLLMVLLSTLAVSNKFDGGEMLLGLAKLGFFLILWFLVGIFVVPSLLKRARKYLSDEILLLVSVGLCFLMVVLANAVGFSSALGAFVMGSILSETIEGEHIEKLTVQIKDLFGAIFFVSVGMMVDPAVIAQYWPVILVLTIVTMLGILIFSTSGVLLSGKGLDTAVRSGFSLAQLGEFSFIIAGLGCSLGVLRDFIYPVVISVSVITTFTTPYMIKAGGPVSALLYKKLPAQFISKVDKVQDPSLKESKAEKGEWNKLLSKYALRVGLYSIILVAIVIFSNKFLDNLLVRLLPDATESSKNLIATAFTLLVMAPFLFGMAVTLGGINEPAVKLIKKNNANKLPVYALMLLRVFIATGFVIIVILNRFTLSWWLLLILILSTAFIILIFRLSFHRLSRMETRFLSNLNAKEDQRRQQAPVATSLKEKMDIYNVHTASVLISQDFAFAGKTLREMPFRDSSGVNIVKIQRGTRSVIIPSGGEQILPGDRLLAVGTAEQLTEFKRIISESELPAEPKADNFVVEPLTISATSNLNGVTLRASNMRASGCMVVSVIRNGHIITNPHADFEINEGDIIWLAGEESSVNWYK